MDLIDHLHWVHATDVPAVEVHFHKATAAEMAAVTGSRFRELGAFVLKRDSTGRWTCEVYLEALSDNETRRHELRHCNGWVHE